MSSSQTLAETAATDRYGVAVLVPCYNEERAIGNDTVTRGRREAKLIAYLALRAPGEERVRS
jgi:hypothetical protein